MQKKIWTGYAPLDAMLEHDSHTLHGVLGAMEVVLRSLLSHRTSKSLGYWRRDCRAALVDLHADVKRHFDQTPLPPWP